MMFSVKCIVVFFVVFFLAGGGRGPGVSELYRRSMSQPKQKTNVSPNSNKITDQGQSPAHERTAVSKTSQG